MEQRDPNVEMGVESAHGKVIFAQVPCGTLKGVTKCLPLFVLLSNYISVYVDLMD